MITDETVLYAISVNHQPRPGFVLDTGNPAAGRKDIRVRRYWRWTDSDDDWLNETPNLTGEGVKFDIQYVGTADVLCRWDVYCRNVKRERQEALQARLDAEAAHEAAKQAELARLDAVSHWLPGDESRAYLDMSDMRYLLGNDRGGDTRYSARHVLDLLERIQDMYLQAAPLIATHPGIDPNEVLGHLHRTGSKS